MKTDPERYQSYLLRLWRGSPQEPWRASLLNVATADRMGFSELEALFLYLCNQTGHRAAGRPVERYISGTKKEDRS